ncbi:MAG TPA: polyphosphate kinase 1 [Planctomycetaceae bacterium]|nr:polyphosphate kinase 1 [Planctomycetaceae bacterium]
MPIEPENYINRELSWLEFNQRVLDLARDEATPLLERLKFLAITSSNLDEFFMVRVGGLQLQHKASIASTDPAGMSVAEQLSAIRDRTKRMIQCQYDTFLEQVEPELKLQGIERIELDAATAQHRDAAQQIFEEEIFPVLSPIAVRRGMHFPLLHSNGLHICVMLTAAKTTDDDTPAPAKRIADPTGEPDTAESGDGLPRFAIIPLGRVLPRIITLPADNGHCYTLLEQVVAHHVDRLFPGEEIQAVTTFRISRNADISLQEDSASDLLHGMKDLLQLRKTADCVRMEIDQNAEEAVVDFLRDCLEVSTKDTISIPGPLDLSAFMPLSGLEGYQHLQYEPWQPQKSPQIDATKTMFENIAEQKILLCHPFESFEPVVRLIQEAADDPDVLAIKQTLYRTSRKSPIVHALRKAAERGKYVTAIVELKARFDEARNIEWAQELEEAQVQVIYGVKNLKTHAKICTIVRREPHGIVRYMHFGTGNYNEATARIYGDISYLTCDHQYGMDASAFFNAVTGYSQPQEFNVLEAAPLGLRSKLLSLIDAEIKRCQQGQPAAIAAKLNSLVDPALIEALYRASQAGVKVDLNIRGICCLRPGVPGLSDHIRVNSIVDRVLEHARIIYFKHGGDDLIYISSADWMPRNLDRRVELLVPIDDPSCRKRLVRILYGYFKDNSNSWKLGEDGCYKRRVAKDTAESYRAQERLYQAAIGATLEAERKRNTVFEPHEPASQQTD